jgi:hypothetical protein
MLFNRKIRIKLGQAEYTLFRYCFNVKSALKLIFALIIVLPVIFPIYSIFYGLFKLSEYIVDNIEILNPFKIEDNPDFTNEIKRKEKLVSLREKYDIK